MIIRDAIEDDMASVQAIYADAVETGTASFELAAPTISEMMHRWDNVLAANGPYLVAEDHGEILGFCYAGPYRPRPAYRFTLEDSVFVARGHDRQGAGTALLGAAIDTSAARGFRQMLAVIGDSANLASQKLHARLGFEPAGTFRAVGFKHGRWLDSVLMQRNLGQGDTTDPRLTPGDAASM